MSLKVAKVIDGSIAAQKGIASEDTIISINGNRIDDFIGLQFHCSEPYLEFLVRKHGKKQLKIIILHQDWQEKLGIVPEEYKIKECCNHCIFCFVDQMPGNLRDTLYVKDDDYLFSFVYGNYISLNRISEDEFERIITERISPLYISVHTTNSSLRKKLMGYNHDLNITDKLLFLSKNKISFHTQIVIIPGMNDGKELNKTITDLAHPEMNTLSIGLVPVGLTKHRENLYPLRSVTPEQADKTIISSRKLSEETGFAHIYCADELYILAGREIPETMYYYDFCQIENGIGMVRALLNNWKKKRRRFVSKLGDEPLLLITAKLAEKFIRMIARDINNISDKKKADVLAVENRFFGKDVTVTGLLTFKDILAEIKKTNDPAGIIALSSNMFNPDGYTIDGIHQKEIKKELKRKILVINELWTYWNYV